MAGGGLIQLVSIGAQDVYLVGNPQITFFKVTYQRHTNFASECIEQTILGTVGFGQKLTVPISRSGDLVGPMFVEFTLPDTLNRPSAISGVNGAEGTSIDVIATANAGPYNLQLISYPSRTIGQGDKLSCSWVDNIGYKLLKEVTIEIGGQPIDRQYSNWFIMWSGLAYTRDKLSVYSLYPYFNLNGKVNVPLTFWFNTHPGLALPLIALQYHEVVINIQLESLDNLYNIFYYPNERLSLPSSFPEEIYGYNKNFIYPDAAADNTDAGPGYYVINPSQYSTLFFKHPDDTKLGVSVFADYYYLDSEERRRFAQLSHEYLIKQVQHIEEPIDLNVSSEYKIDYKTLNHPVCFHGFNVESSLSQQCNMNYMETNVIDTHKLILNGNDRYSSKSGSYYQQIQPFNHFVNNRYKDYVYSFALQPIEHQPSGTLNFSRIDNAYNVFKTPDQQCFTPGSATFRVFVTNYNVLRIMSGMGGLAYSN